MEHQAVVLFRSPPPLLLLLPPLQRRCRDRRREAEAEAEADRGGKVLAGEISTASRGEAGLELVAPRVVETQEIFAEGVVVAVVVGESDRLAQSRSGGGLYTIPKK